jgi:RHS repeat-associated protein
VPTVRNIALIFFCVLLLTGSGSAIAQTFCVPPKPAPPSPPQDPPCPECEPKECNKCTKSPVYVGAGTYVRDDTDLAIATTGLGISVLRHYDSSRLIDGPLGIGWTSSLTARVHYATYVSAPNTFSHKAYVVLPGGVLFEFEQLTYQSGQPNAFTPPNGRRDALVRNTNETFTLTMEGGAPVLQFNSDGTISSMRDEFGNALNYTYDANGRLERVADGAGSGRYVDVTWNPNGRIDAISDSASRSLRYTYNADGSLAGVTDTVTPPGTLSTRYTYVSGRFGPRLQKVEDRWYRLITRIAWDSGDRVMSYTDGAYDEANPSQSTGEKYSYTYFPKGNGSDVRPQTVKSDSFGSHTYTYGANGLVTNDLTQYDGEGRVIRSEDDDHNVSLYTYDSMGRLLTESIYEGLPVESKQPSVVWTYTWDTAFPWKVATRKSNKPHLWRGTRYEYYPQGSATPGALWRLRQFRTDGTTEDIMGTYTHDQKGRLTAMSTAGETTTAYTYNTAGDRTGVAQYGRGSVSFTSDDLGRTISATDEAGSVTSYTWDAADRPLTVTLPKPSATSNLNFTTSYEYDIYDAATGLVFTNVTDPNGRVTRTGYDALGHVVQVVDALGSVTTYTWRRNLLHNITDANGNVTQFAYDTARHLTSVTHPDGTVQSTVYLQNGTIESVTDRNGVKQTFTYDQYQRLRRVVYENQTWANGVQKAVQFDYDGEKLMSVWDQLRSPTARYEYTYDDFFRVATEGYSDSTKISYDYSATAGRTLDSFTITPPLGSGDRTTTIHYTYDGGGRVRTTSFDQVNTPEVTIDYTLRGQYSTLTFANGMTREYTYDSQGRLTKVANLHPTTGNVATYEYGYDTNWSSTPGAMLGQRDRVIVTSDVPNSPSTGTTKYRYDANYRLVGADYPNGTIERWTYDAIGNRLTASGVSSTVTYAYYKYAGNTQNSNRLQSLSNSSTTYTYDSNGNRLTNATWDVANRLTSYFGKTFNYSWDNRRTDRETTTYVYQDLHAVREKDAVLPAVLNDYIFGPGVDQPLVRKDIVGNRTYYVIDGLGSVTARLDTSGAIVETSSYLAWGRGSQPDIGYTAREVAATGILYYRARYYEPTTGRFLSEDPLGYTEGPNFYAYANGDPVNNSDPMGLASSCVATPWMKAPVWHSPPEGGPTFNTWEFVGEIPFDVLVVKKGGPVPAIGWAPGKGSADAIGLGACHCKYANTGARRRFTHFDYWKRTVTCQPCTIGKEETMKTFAGFTYEPYPSIYPNPPQIRILGGLTPCGLCKPFIF